MPTIYVLSKNMENIKNFHLKIFNFSFENFQFLQYQKLPNIAWVSFHIEPTFPGLQGKWLYHYAT